ncbi:MAG TPA: DUF1521 domain-containing protein [Paraburkholderia sp.]
MQATFDSRSFTSYGQSYNPFGAQTQRSYSTAQPASNAFYDSRQYGNPQSRPVSTHFEQITRTPNGSTIKTSMTTIRQPGGQYGQAQDNRFNGRNDNSCRFPQRTPPPPAHNSNCDSRTNWSNTPVNGNKATVDLGQYQLDFDKKDSSINMRDKATGDTTKIWGDPHIDMHNGTADKKSGMFNGPLTFNLPDNTKVTVGTKSSGNAAVSYADQVTITRGKDAYQVNGLSEKNSSGLTVDRSRDGRALDAATPDGYSLVANRNGKGWIDPATGKEPTAADFKLV